MSDVLRRISASNYLYRLIPAFYGLVVLLFLYSCEEQRKEIHEVVTTNEGAVSGVFNEDTNVYSFKGIPYAKAPVDSLRWTAPRPSESRGDTLNATEFGPICMQPNPQPFSMWTREFIAPTGNMSEDCLSLNIWTAEGAVDAKRPVIVFIHGGGFSSGSGSVPIYDGERMAEKGVVFVTINYRVGVFGFLAHRELTEESPHNASGNYGLLDQIAALGWIQSNISKFGGNPNNVTIAGQSAGAFSVSYLVASPLTDGLFHKAIVQSGGVFLASNRVSRDNSLENAEQNGLKISEALGTESISELKELPAESLLEVPARFAPNIDGYVIPESGYKIFKKGGQHDVPLLTGWNADDGIVFETANDAEDFRNTIREQFPKYSDEVLRLFPADNDSMATASQFDLSKLTLFGLQSWKWTQLQNETGTAPVYMYYFTREVPFSDEQQDYGAFHTSEVTYAYNNLEKGERPWEPVDVELSDMMSSYWVNFSKNGDPNGEGLPNWPATTPDANQVMYFGDSVKTKSMPSKDRLLLLDKIFTERMNQ